MKQSMLLVWLIWRPEYRQNLCVFKKALKHSLKVLLFCLGYLVIELKKKKNRKSVGVVDTDET